MVAAASHSGGVFQRQVLGKWSEKTESWMQLNTERSIMKTWFRALRILRLGWKFTFQHDNHLRTQPRQCRSGLGTTLWTSSSGPARAGTWNQSDIFGETYKCYFAIISEMDLQFLSKNNFKVNPAPVFFFSVRDIFQKHKKLYRAQIIEF